MRAFTLALVALLLAGAAAASEIPRTASGRPDLSGTYDIGNLTPIERPEQFGERLELTAAEAASVVQGALDRETKGNAASDPNRSAPEAGGNIGAYNQFFFDRGSGPTKVGDSYRSSILTDPPNGRYPPFSGRGEKRREGMFGFLSKNSGEAWWLGLDPGPFDGPESLSIADRCLLSLEATIPIFSKSYNNLKTVVQTDTHLMILVEWMHEARIVRIDGERPPAQVRSRSGESVGRWDGDTLVVETTNFLEEQWVTKTLFGEQSPAAGQRVVERFTRVNVDELLYQFTVETPDREAPYSGEYTWAVTDGKLYEYACHEGNYSMGNVLRGSRLLEREAAEAGGR